MWRQGSPAFSRKSLSWVHKIRTTWVVVIRSSWRPHSVSALLHWPEMGLDPSRWVVQYRESGIVGSCELLGNSFSPKEGRLFTHQWENCIFPDPRIMTTGGDAFRKKAEPQLNRRRQMDKDRALGTATNPSSSKFGSALLSSTQDGRALNNEVSKLERQLKRTQLHIEHEQKRFLQKQQQLPEPTLIVVRPPSPLLTKKFLYWNKTSDAPYTHAPDEPSYMNSIRSKVRAPLAQPTIDAFSVKVRKKKNIWEEALNEDAHFTSAVQPCWPLTSVEEAELRAGWQLHARPTTAPGVVLKNPMTVQHRVDSAKRKPGILKNNSKATFITEVLQAKKETEGSVRKYVLKKPTTMRKKEVQWRS
ncbi:hypothetical protein CAPTEDRAFT_190371 [Capitella teleta]|uniref:Uncharacterized protein n=1 Tax=Capitella teleta TaxID=283909 RepID=R7TCJ1_CAPTE|nr:hypothetical protein CAPTEDRAFT_190371 [Capitella teleta]|eukprot:ELT91448.1 hypothetical protein CAPTEDRAFT_190371 [Capitella teleta]